MFLPKAVGYIEEVAVYEYSRLGRGEHSGGLALPGIGIFVGRGTFSRNPNSFIVKHEYGHILQSRLVGKFRFYLFIGLPSLLSAWLNWHGKGHQKFWTETWANELAKRYFSDQTWPEYRFPSKPLNKSGWKKIVI